jgi:hypothetical protein
VRVLHLVSRDLAQRALQHVDRMPEVPKRLEASGPARDCVHASAEWLGAQEGLGLVEVPQGPLGPPSALEAKAQALLRPRLDSAQPVALRLPRDGLEGLVGVFVSSVRQLDPRLLEAELQLRGEVRRPASDELIHVGC